MTSQDTLPSSSTAPPSSPATTETIDLTDVPPPNPRLTALQTKKANLERTLADLVARRNALVSQSTLPSGLAMPDDWSLEQKQNQALSNASVVIKEHIGLLHTYNEIKDIGQGLMGLVAEQRGVRIKVVQEDFGCGEKD